MFKGNKRLVGIRPSTEERVLLFRCLSFMIEGKSLKINETLLNIEMRK